MNESICILLATYNGEKYIEEQLESIINQTYKNWYIYISDDGSRDNTLNIINEYKKKYNKQIIICENNSKKHGAKNNFSNLVKKVPRKYDYYMLCDQDDTWEMNKIELMLKKIKELDKQTPALVYSDAYVVDEKLNILNDSLIEYTGKKMPQNDLMKHILIENFFPGCVVMFNRKLLETIVTIYEETEMHDWWITIVASAMGKIYFIEEKLHYYRQHSNNTVGAHGSKIKLKSIFNKIINIKRTLMTWHNYQKIVRLQAEELLKRYPESDNYAVIKQFYEIMCIKNRILRLIKLASNGYYPTKKIRIIRLAF